MKCKRCVGLVAAALVMFLTGSATGQVTEDAQITGGLLVHNRPYRVGTNLTLQVTRSSGTDFVALVGPLPNAPIGASTVFSANQVAGTSNNLLVELVLDGADGFIFMSGIQPYGGTDGGSTSSEGTSMVIQRITLAGVPYHRYFRLESSYDVNVAAVNPPDTELITANNHYVEKTTGTALSSMTRIPRATEPDPLEIRKFILEVLTLAADAGLPTPPTPP